MRKFKLFTIVALLLSMTAMAQNKQHVLSQQRMASLSPNAKTEAKTAVPKKSLQKQVDLRRMQSARETLAAKKANGKINGLNAMHKVSKVAKADIPFISEQPEGTQMIYSRSGSAYYVYIFYVVNTSFTGGVGNVVFGPGNEVYIQDIISQVRLGSWIKGTLNGNKITIDFPYQAADLDGDVYYVELLKYDANEQWYVPSEKQSLTLDYDPATGTISSPENSAIATGESIIGLVDDGFEWVGYADWDVNMTKMTDEPVTAPAGIETEVYSLSAPGYSGSLCNVGFDGNDIYVQGLYEAMPDAWVKGTVSGDKVTFSNGQYIGPDMSMGLHQYLVSATVEQVWDDYYGEFYDEYTLADQDIVFDYDATTKSLTNSSVFLINAGKDEVYYAAAFSEAQIKPFEEVAATPANPTLSTIYEGGYSYYSWGYGWGYLLFNIPCSDTDGNFIVADKLSYVVYTKVNGEVKEYTLSPEDYIYLDEPMTEIPYNYSDNYDVGQYGTDNYLYYYVVGPEEFGVQSIYRGAGEERRSEIVWAQVQSLGSEVQPDAATPEYPEVDPSDTGNSIDYGYYTGAEDVYTFGESKEETYDVAIHLQDQALRGTHIESITIPIMDLTGVSNVSVWISSQLRVEDNKNVPDLAQIAVTPAEPGFVTVKLDKPYVIPEEGVYVGYSFDIDEVSNEESAYPVAVITQVNEGGFYLHTSKSFLKWFDVSEMIGASALIQVTVSGSNVKANAATPLEGEQTFVMTGSEIEIPVEIVNHGSEGIKSLDIEYSLADQAGVKHIDLDEPVEGFFGKSLITDLTFPGINERGNYSLVLTVAKVNGEYNEDAVIRTTIPLVLLNNVPKHRTLLEEYTGTWCGWCPRGYVALEALSELYPDDYVLISYHNSDPMEIMYSDQFPSPVAGFPSAWMDRMTEVDPYYGTSEDTELGVADDMAKRAKSFGVASIDLESTLSQSKVTVTVNAKVTFPFTVENGNYALEYVLVEDGLTGTDSDWGQSNYYSGGSYGDMSFFDESESTVSGLVFNDVAVLTSRIGGIDGSIPANVEADTPVAHKYTFYLYNALNTSNEKVIQDPDKLKVVAILIDRNTGEVLNANKVKVNESTGISGVKDSNAQLVSVEYYDLGGRKLSSLQKGGNIVVMRFADGSHQTIKMLK